MEGTRSLRSNPRRHRRHAAARARVAAGVMSVAAFVGLGAAVAARTPASAVARASNARSNAASSSTTTEAPSFGSAVSGGFAVGDTPVTTSHGS